MAPSAPRSPPTAAASEALLLLFLFSACADPSSTATPDDVATLSSDPAAAETVARDSRPAQARRAAAREALLSGRIVEGKALLAGLWAEAPGPERADDLVLLMAAEAREGALDRGLALLAEAESAKLSTASLADLAAALSTNLPDPAVAAAKILAKLPATRSAAHAAALARLHERTGEVRAALPYWSIAARLAPTEPTYPRELARLHAITGNPRGLETALRQLVELAPRDLAARVDLVRVLARAGRRDEALARARPPEALLSGTDADLFEADVLLRASLPAEALTRYDAILREAPEICEATFGRARALLLVGQEAKAAALFHALIAHKVGARPCKVVEAVRGLARLPSWNRHHRKLARLARRRGGADPAALAAVLEALDRNKQSSRSTRRSRGPGR